MRTKSTMLFGVSFLAFACLIASTGLDASAGDKKPPEKASPEKVSAEEIETLVKHLGDNNYGVRDRASKRLEQMPGALAELRLLLKHNDLEIRRRVERLVESLSAKNLKSLLREIVEKKEDVPLDLLIDVVVEYRERMDEDDWKGVLNAIASVKANLLKDIKTNATPPEPLNQFLKYPLISSESLSRFDRPFQKKVVGNRFGAEGEFTSSVIIASASFESRVPTKSVVLANGGILMRGSTGSLVFSNEEIKCRSANFSVIIARGTVNVTLESDNVILQSVVFSGGDINCDQLIDSTAFAMGRVNAKRITRSTIFKKDTKSARVSYFSLKAIGLSLVPDGKAFRIEKVVPGSRASKCGFRTGDLLMVDARSGLARLDTVLRQRVAKEIEPAIPVRRNGEPAVVILRLWD